MDEATLPERLRALADELEAEGEAWTRIIREALREAAGELERLTGRPEWLTESDRTVAERLRASAARIMHLLPDHNRGFGIDHAALLRAGADELERESPATGRPLVDAFEVLELLELHGERHAPAGTDRGARGGTHAGGLRAAAAIVRELAGLDGAGSLPAGTSAKVAERLAAGLPDPSPMSRRFAVRYLGGWGPPAAGSFVFAGPALAVWRVLTVDELAGHVLPPGLGMGEPLPATHALELEPVDGHDVPMLARVAEVPAPIDELDGDALYSEPADDDGEADS